MNYSVFKYVISGLFFLLFINCNRATIPSQFEGNWQLVHIYEENTDLLNNDSEMIIIVDYMIVDKYGNFIMDLLTIDEQIKGELIINDSDNYITIKSASNPKFNNRYEMDTTFLNDGYTTITELLLISDKLQIVARKQSN
ncbi:hypothetical protein [uncultured Psychroserpens sp.]|uniref:hypothetical protein n=1 Tax=uncultured Psychroserpens sp. TaxID=255436 RepID=UPI002637DB69|nr:hypothetical protein [uncultured Psychroserpens sp.]